MRTNTKTDSHNKQYRIIPREIAMLHAKLDINSKAKNTTNKII